MKLQIPKSHQSLRERIEYCLQLARIQGFDTSLIELSVTPRQCFIFSDSSSNEKRSFTLSLESSSTLMKDANEADWNLYYLCEEESHLNLDGIKTILQQFPNKIVLGLLDENRFIDFWSCQSTNNESTINCSSNRRAIFYEIPHAGEFSPEEQMVQEHLSWLLTALCLEFPIEDALVLARAAVIQIEAKSIVKEEHWCVSRETWPIERCYFPTPLIEHKGLGIVNNFNLTSTQYPFPRLNKPSLGLYPVVDDVAWIERLLALGIKTVQLRIKNPKQADLEEQIIKAIALGKKYQAQVFINDYWQLAIKHQAFGVHLGQEDLEIADLTKLNQAAICLGLSTHGYYELLKIVQLAPSYIALGHIFPTTTKVMPSKPQGLVRLKLYQQLIDSIAIDGLSFPTVAIGGINLDTAPAVWECKVSSLAVVRAVTEATDLKLRLKEFEAIMEKSDLGESC